MKVFAISSFIDAYTSVFPIHLIFFLCNIVDKDEGLGKICIFSYYFNAFMDFTKRYFRLFLYVGCKLFPCYQEIHENYIYKEKESSFLEEHRENRLQKVWNAWSTFIFLLPSIVNRSINVEDKSCISYNI